jgi:hypothetical protein
MNQKEKWLVVLKGMINFLLTGTNSEKAYQNLISLFCSTSGKSSDTLHKIVSFFRPKKKFSASSIFKETSDEKINAITKDLNTKGYHILDEKLPLELLNIFVRYAENNEMQPEYPPGYPESDKVTRLKFDSSNVKTVRYHFPEEEIINLPEYQQLITDSFFLRVAQSYLDCLPYSDASAFWWLTNYSKIPDAQAATMWHFDMDRIKWLKIFIYLNDVTEENGPHSFVEGSHLSGNIPSELLQYGYARLTDEMIEKNYPKEKILSFKAKKGTIIFEDTRGLHKGMPALKGHRLLLQLQFSDWGFGGIYPERKIKSFANNSIEKFIKKNTKIYHRYL